MYVVLVCPNLTEIHQYLFAHIMCLIQLSIIYESLPETLIMAPNVNPATFFGNLCGIINLHFSL